MIITEICPYGKMKSRVLTDEGLVFSVYRSELNKYGLEEGRELTDEVLEGVLYPMLKKRAVERVVRLLKEKDYTEAELMRKLRLSYCPEECARQAVQWALERHYVDDRRYAENYIRWHAEGKSRRRILLDLQEKGVPREVAEELLETTPPDEEAQILRELRKRRFDPENADLKERKRTAAFLMRKGYSWVQIESALRTYETGEEVSQV